MDDKNFNTFIDFGKSGIRAISFKKGTEKVENYIEQINRNIESNNFSSEEELIEDIIFNLEKKNGEYIDEIFLMVDDLNILSISLTISKKYDEKILIDDFLKSLIEDAKFEININYPTYEIIHTINRYFFLDKQKFSQIPKNLIYNNFAVELNFIIFPKSLIENFTKIFAKQNVTIKKFIFSSYSKSLFYLNKIANQKKIIFVDIGFEKICTFLFENKKMEQFKIIPIGGNHITKDISKILNIDIFKADSVKLNFDNINNNKDLKEKQIELVKKIIFSRIEELLEISTLFFRGNNDLKNIKLVFFGNGSKILDSKFKSNIAFNYDIDLLEENYVDVCLSGLSLVNSENKTFLNKINSKKKKKGFFENFFHLFG